MSCDALVENFVQSVPNILPYRCQKYRYAYGFIIVLWAHKVLFLRGVVVMIALTSVEGHCYYAWL